MYSSTFSCLSRLTPYSKVTGAAQPSHSTTQGDVWALSCILAEMIGNVRPWLLVTPGDSSYPMHCLVRHATYFPFKRMFSSKPEQWLSRRHPHGGTRDGHILPHRYGSGRLRMGKSICCSRCAHAVPPRCNHVTLRRHP